MHTVRNPPSIVALVVCTAVPVLAQDANDKAIVVLVSDADRMNIGQDGYCGKRTEIERPKDRQFRIPAGVETFVFVRTTFRLSYGTYVCEGDFSFTPDSNLHIIRYTIEDRQCRLEMFKGTPGATPQAIPYKVEQLRSCITQ